MSSSPFDREHESYEPNYLTPGYETSGSPGDSDPTAPEAEPPRPARAAAEPGPVTSETADWSEGSAESAGPDFSSAYETFDDEPVSPSVYDEGYVTPSPAPVVETGYQVPAPMPVNQQRPPLPQPMPQPMRPQNYGYGYQPNVTPYQQPYPMQPYPYSYGPVVPEHPSSTTVGVLGLASFAVWVTAPIAWYMGAKAKKEIARGAPYRFSGLAQFGYVVGIIYSIFGALFFGLMMLGILFG